MRLPFSSASSLPDNQQIDNYVRDRIARSEDRLQPLLPSINERYEFWMLSRYVPSVMMFVPSIGGRSHHISENTSDADIVRGAQVLLRAVERFIAKT